jgi:hypothetical protein
VTTLSQRITDLAAAVRAKFNVVVPRLLPAGGAAGLYLRKTTSADFDAAWTSEAWTFLKLAADYTVSVTTASDVPGLGFTPAPNKTYVVQGIMLLRTSNTGSGPLPGVAFPTGLTDQVAEIIASTSTTNVVIQQNNGAGVMSVATGGLPNTTTSWFSRVEALLVAGATPSGKFRIQLASETAARVVTMKAGSYLAFREI